MPGKRVLRLIAWIAGWLILAVAFLLAASYVVWFVEFHPHLLRPWFLMLLADGAPLAAILLLLINDRSVSVAGRIVLSMARLVISYLAAFPLTGLFYGVVETVVGVAAMKASISQIIFLWFIALFYEPDLVTAGGGILPASNGKPPTDLHVWIYLVAAILFFLLSRGWRWLPAWQRRDLGSGDKAP